MKYVFHLGNINIVPFLGKVKTTITNICFLFKFAQFVFYLQSYQCDSVKNGRKRLIKPFDDFKREFNKYLKIHKINKRFPEYFDDAQKQIIRDSDLAACGTATFVIDNFKKIQKGDRKFAPSIFEAIKLSH